MSDFIREVDEDYRRDRIIASLRRLRWPLIALAVLIVAATAGWRLWETRSQQARDAAGARYEAAARLAAAGQSDAADAAFTAITADGASGYALLARFRVAAGKAASDPAAATKLYDTLASDASIGATMQDLARLRAAELIVDSADAVEMHRRLDPLTTPDNPFHNSARELLALKALAADDTATAGKLLDMIVIDPQAPADMRQRAGDLLGLVSGGAPAP